MSSLRTQGRRLAVQILYSMEYGEEESRLPIGELVENISPKSPIESREFAAELVRGVQDRKTEIDQTLSEVVEHWSLERIHPLERCILRLALFEIRHRLDVPVKVAINEAVDLAKRFGDDDAWRLVNGITDRLAAARILPPSESSEEENPGERPAG